MISFSAYHTLVMFQFFNFLLAAKLIQSKYHTFILFIPSSYTALECHR